MTDDLTRTRAIINAAFEQVDDALKLALARKQTSPEISALAAKYLAMEELGFLLAMMPEESSRQVAADIKKLAASCLSQDETKGQG